MSHSRLLTFSTLDDIAFAAERKRLNNLSSSLKIITDDLGPFLELVQLSAAGLLPIPERASWLTLDGVESLYCALVGGRARWVCPETRQLGFFRTEAELPHDEQPWVQFGLAAQKAVVGAGFHKQIAAQIIGALGEMHSNIYEHSGASGTGLIAFKARPKSFEFLVADQGMGVLASLKSCPEYAALTDHGEAMRLTLTDGVSRHGTGMGHGRGFRPLFIGLANLHGSLRFRSGNHALTIEGQIPTDLMRTKPALKPQLPGFFLASVICRLP